MKIYTRTGDDGTTGLFGGQRVSKTDPRIECYGTVDELNAAIGLAIAALNGPAEPPATPAARPSPEPPPPQAPAISPLTALASRLHRVQNDLFGIGSRLATPSPAKAKALPPLGQAMIEELESEIDAAQADLTPLRQFILPGGSEAAARLHVARTICRRAERLLVAFELGVGDDARPPAVVLAFVNRLSDWLFVQARWVNHQLAVDDVPWVKRK